MTETSQPRFFVFQTQLDDYYILGISHTDNDPSKLAEFWGQYDGPKNQLLRDYTKKHSKPGNRLIGLMYTLNPPEHGRWNYIVGGIVEGIGEAPEGSSLEKFPASEFFVVTHEWVSTAPKADRLIGLTVAYAHSEEVQGQIPEGYERYNNPVIFKERFNYNFDENKFRTEIWFAIRRIADSSAL